jgi:hypothetical protein
MRRDRGSDYRSSGTQSDAQHIPPVAELAKRMSELIRLRDRVKKAERSIRLTAASSRRGACGPVPIK